MFKNMALALDTNCIIRWLVWDIPEQAQLVEDILTGSKKEVHVADLAIAETVWVFKSVFHYDDYLIAGLISKLIMHKRIDCNRTLFERVLTDFERSPKVSFVDLCLAHYAGLAGAKLLTFDKTLAKKLPKFVELA